MPDIIIPVQYIILVLLQYTLHCHERKQYYDNINTNPLLCCIYYIVCITIIEFCSAYSTMTDLSVQTFSEASHISYETTLHTPTLNHHGSIVWQLTRQNTGIGSSLLCLRTLVLDGNGAILPAAYA